MTVISLDKTKRSRLRARQKSAAKGKQNHSQPSGDTSPFEQGEQTSLHDYSHARQGLKLNELVPIFAINEDGDISLEGYAFLVAQGRGLHRYKVRFLHEKQLYERVVLPEWVEKPASSLVSLRDFSRINRRGSTVGEFFPGTSDGEGCE